MYFYTHDFTDKNNQAQCKVIFWKEINRKTCTSNTWTGIFIYPDFKVKNQAYCNKSYFLKQKTVPGVAGMFTSIPFI